jgi:hypothetical protein
MTTIAARGPHRSGAHRRGHSTAAAEPAGTADVLRRVRRIGYVVLGLQVIGLPVCLGQVICAQHGLQFGEAIISNRPEGQTPVAATTNVQGVATFTISSPVGSGNPVYFATNLVKSSSGYPHRDSPILAVRFQS